MPSPCAANASPSCPAVRASERPGYTAPRFPGRAWNECVCRDLRALNRAYCSIARDHVDSPDMWVKICGVRDEETALAAAGAGASAIGFNFYHRSPRAVTMEAAAQIVARLPTGVEPVGVFVNDTPERIRGICRFCKIAVVQLHGDEHPVRTAEL